MDHRWFSGPGFLYKNKDDWPQGKRIKEEERSEDCVAEITKPKMTSRQMIPGREWIH